MFQDAGIGFWSIFFYFNLNKIFEFFKYFEI